MGTAMTDKKTGASAVPTHVRSWSLQLQDNVQQIVDAAGGMWLDDQKTGVKPQSFIFLQEDGEVTAYPVVVKIDPEVAAYYDRHGVNPFRLLVEKTAAESARFMPPALVGVGIVLSVTGREMYFNESDRTAAHGLRIAGMDPSSVWPTQEGALFILDTLEGREIWGCVRPTGDRYEPLTDPTRVHLDSSQVRRLFPKIYADGIGTDKGTVFS